MKKQSPKVEPIQDEDERIAVLNHATAALQLLGLLRNQPPIRNAHGDLIEQCGLALAAAIDAAWACHRRRL